jgi:hypothetical protein
MGKMRGEIVFLLKLMPYGQKHKIIKQFYRTIIVDI